MKLESHDLDSIKAVMLEGLPGGQVAEVLRLARLGLWAEERGIPALTVYKNSPMLKRPGDFEGQLFFPARDALAALPAVGAAPGEREKR